MIQIKDVVVEFPGAGSSGIEARAPEQLVRLTGAPDKAGLAFTLYKGSRRMRTLTTAETHELLRLVDAISLTSPWNPGPPGFDGVSCGLIVRHQSCEVAFRWWMRPPEGWHGVGALFQYARALAGFSSP